MLGCRNGDALLDCALRSTVHAHELREQPMPPLQLGSEQSQPHVPSGICLEEGSGADVLVELGAGALAGPELD